MSKPSKEEAMAAVRTLLRYAGEDPDRSGLLETPSRVVKSYQELFAGYAQDPREYLKVFDDHNHYDEIIVLKGVRIWSMCEHHMLPFHGVAHVGYLPDAKVIGVSKLARIVEVFARRLQVQERLTSQIANALLNFLGCLGAGCVIEATHLCMGCRGVKQHEARMVTSTLLGTFRDPDVKQEFLSLISR